MYKLDGVDIEDVPDELLALRYFKNIVPYAFKQIKSISATTNAIDELLSDLLTGIYKMDKFAQMTGIKFEKYPDGHPRVC